MNNEDWIWLHNNQKPRDNCWLFYRKNNELFWIQFALLILFSSFSYAQTPTRDQLTGTWIGVHTEWDTDFFCPLPIYLQLDADSTYHLGMVDRLASKIRSTWAVRGDSVRLDTVHYAPRLVQLQNDLLRIGTFYPMVFRKFNSIHIDSASVYKQVNGRVWQSDSLIISLYTNGRVSLENPITKQRTAHFWQLVRFDSSVFLVIRGNQHNLGNGYKPLWQISRLSPNQLQAIGWNGRSIATETFRLVRALASGDSCRPSGFQTCDNCFSTTRYTTVLNADERFTLKRLFEQHYQVGDKPGESGLISIKFVVTCTGERGLFQLTGVDEAYHCKDFDPQITQQLMTICREHVRSDFSAFITDLPGHRSHDTAISLSFRLKDGHLIDILP